MARVFVSHAGDDTEPARRLHGWLITDGHEVFLDRDLRSGITLGDEWRRRLRERLRWADAVVCVLTDAYVASPWCSAELATAETLGSRLLPVAAQPGIVHPLLDALQFGDLTRDPDHVRAALAEALLRVDAVGGWGWPDGRSPYPGLRPFERDMHQVFFGREHDVEELAKLVRAQAGDRTGAALYLVGPSGCGKSSLVRAGLLPMLAEESGWWVLQPFVPGDDPVAALFREVATAATGLGMGWSESDVRRRVVDGGLGETVSDLLLAVPGGTARHLLVVVDQFEELITRGSGPARARFAEVLAPAMTRSLQLVTTLRPEFLAPLLASRELGELPYRLHTVRMLGDEALRSVITEPARRAGIAIDGHLVDQLVEDTAGGEALPLLAYTLAELAEGVGTGGRLLASRYRQLGRVEGSLVRQAEEALDDAVRTGGRSRGHVLKELLRLVTVDEQGRPTRSRVRRSDLAKPATDELDAFVARRLLITDRDPDGRSLIGIAHEAFLSAWPRLQELIADTTKALQARRTIDQAAERWQAEQRPTARLWERGQLASALNDTGSRVRWSSGGEGAAGRRWRRTLVSDRVELGPAAAEFLLSSYRRDRRLRRMSVSLLSALLVLALIAAGFAWVQRGVAEDQRVVAITRQLLAQADAARAGDPRTALMLGVAAHQLAPESATEAGLVDTLTHTPLARSLDHGTDITWVAVTRDGRTLAAAGVDGTAQLWDIGAPGRPRPIGAPLAGHKGYLYSVAFTPDGRTLATAGADGRVVLWNIADPAAAQPIGSPLTGHAGPVHDALFDPSGRLLATAGFDHLVLLFDVSDPARPRPIAEPLRGHTDIVTRLAFSPDGTTMASAGFDGTVRRWDLRDPERPRPLGAPLIGHTNTVWGVAFAPDGRTLASAGADGLLARWDLTDPAQPRPLGPLRTGRAGPLYGLAFTPDSRRVALAGSDRTLTVLDLAAPQPQAEALVGHTNQVYSVLVTPDGRTLASAGADGTVLLWDLAGPPQPRPVGVAVPGAAVHALAVGAGGELLAAGRADGTIELSTPVEDPGPARSLGAPFPAHAGTVWSVALSADGSTLASGGADGAVGLWDVSDPVRPRRRGDPITGLGGEVLAVAFSPDGLTLAAAGTDRVVRLWDVTDPDRPRPGATGARHNGRVFALAFSPDGRTLASSGADTGVILWDASDPTGLRMLGAPLVAHTGPVYSVEFAEHGTLLASAGGDGAIQLWDVTRPDQARPLGRQLLGHTGPVYRVAFSADGRTLVSGGADGTGVLWDLTDLDRPRPLGPPLRVHTGPVNGALFVPHGSRLVTAGGDGRIQAWELAALDAVRAEPAAAACAVAGRGLDPDDWGGYLPDVPYRVTCPD